jgi:NAD(P)-dependent dehydrogenase (short-subunit alcohol dehydrogenase family)
MSTSTTWFVTGASQGLGLALVRRLLREGHRVAATSRRAAELARVVGPHDNFLPLAVQLTDEASVQQALAATRARFGRLDVVVNNAGYGIGGSLEELSDAEVRQAFDVNVFGALHVIRHALPELRRQQAGHIINVSSIAGLAPTAGWAIYAATKFAVEGFSDALAQDVAPFGIKVTLIEPGAFRTNFLTPESLVLARQPLEAYEAVRESHRRYLQLHGSQAGDPEKAAAAIMGVAAEPQPPLRLLLGSDAYQRAHRKLDVLRQEFEQWQALTRSTDFAAEPAR